MMMMMMNMMTMIVMKQKVVKINPTRQQSGLAMIQQRQQQQQRRRQRLDTMIIQVNPHHTYLIFKRIIFQLKFRNVQIWIKMKLKNYALKITRRLIIMHITNQKHGLDVNIFGMEVVKK